jgi:hypothetical protein
METTALGHYAGNSFTAVQCEEDNHGIGLAFTNNLYVLNARAIQNGNTRLQCAMSSSNICEPMAELLELIPCGMDHITHFVTFYNAAVLTTYRPITEELERICKESMVD